MDEWVYDYLLPYGCYWEDDEDYYGWGPEPLEWYDV